MTYKLIDNESNLSPSARKVVDDLKDKLNRVINADRVREPKLTPEETQEIARLEATIAKYTPCLEPLLRAIDDNEKRLKLLIANYTDLILEGEEMAEKIAEEMQLLPNLIQVLLDTRRNAALYVNTSEMKIQRIKEAAREREVKNGS